MKAVCLFCLIVVALFSFVGCTGSKTPTSSLGNNNVTGRLYPEPPLVQSPWVQDELHLLRDSFNLPRRAEELDRDLQGFRENRDVHSSAYWFYTVGRSLAQLAVALQEAPATRRTIYLSIFEQGITTYRRQVCSALVKSPYQEDQAVLRWVKQLNSQDFTTWSPPGVLLRGALE